MIVNDVQTVQDRGQILVHSVRGGREIVISDAITR